MPSGLSWNHQGGPELQARIVAGQRRQLAAVGGLIQREEDDRQLGLVAEAVQQRLQRVHVVGRHRECRRPCRGRKRSKSCAIVVAERCRDGSASPARRPGSCAPSRSASARGTARRRSALGRPATSRARTALAPRALGQVGGARGRMAVVGGGAPSFMKRRAARCERLQIAAPAAATSSPVSSPSRCTFCAETARMLGVDHRIGAVGR